MTAHQDRGQGRSGPRSAGPAVPVPAAVRSGQAHPSWSLTVVHDGADRVDAVALWLGAPPTVHPGDQVGWPRGGLAPSGTYSVRLTQGYLHVQDGTLTAWQDVPGPGPLLTLAGELHRALPPAAPNVVPLRRPDAAPGPGPGSVGGGPTGRHGTNPAGRVLRGPAAARSRAPWSGVELTCPCRNAAGLRLADEQDEVRERERARRTEETAQAEERARRLLLSGVCDDGGADVESLAAGLTQALTEEPAIGPLVQRIVVGVPSTPLAQVLGRLSGDGGLTGEGSADFRAAYRVLAQRALAVHGSAVLDALPVSLVADGMAADALVLPRLERLLGRPLPGELGRMARWALHGLDGSFGEVDRRCVEVALLALGVLT